MKDTNIESSKSTFKEAVSMIQNTSKDDLEELIAQWIHNKRNREILRLRFIDGIRYDELAEKFDLSVTRVKEIVRKSACAISAHIM